MNGAGIANSVYRLAMDWMVWGLILGRSKRFSFLQTPSAQLYDPHSFLLREYFSSPLGESCWCMNLTTHLHLVVKFRMTGALRLLDMHAFMAWTRTTRNFNYLYDIMK